MKQKFLLFPTVNFKVLQFKVCQPCRDAMRESSPQHLPDLCTIQVSADQLNLLT